MNYESAVQYILNIASEKRGKTDHDTLQKYLDLLGNPEKNMKFLHIAGTNGKGSVCAYITSVLHEAGYATGMFTSPHLVSLRERIVINKNMISKDLFVEVFLKVLNIVNISDDVKIADNNKNLTTNKNLNLPTFFEFLFLMGLVAFDMIGVDYAIIETGIGGKSDCTNIIPDKEIAVITSISLDHTNILGSDICSIAGEKAGIIANGKPVVFDFVSHEVAKVIENAAIQNDSQYLFVQECDFNITAKSENGTDFMTTYNAKECYFNIKLLGEHQVKNAVIAIKALECLTYSDENISQLNFDKIKNKLSYEVVFNGIKNTVWAGRLEKIKSGIYVDGAHNEGAIKIFVKNIRELLCKEDKAHLVFTVASDKSYNKMIKLLCDKDLWDLVSIVDIGYSRMVENNLLKQLFEEAGINHIDTYSTFNNAMKHIIENKKPEDKIFFAGSLYLVGAVKSYFTS
jgi:folylpolyglutamate synthase/dihydrofolate synthase